MILQEIFFYKYYIPLVKNKDFDTLVDNKSFFDQHVKNNQEVYEKLLKMSRIIIIQEKIY